MRCACSGCIWERKAVVERAGGLVILPFLLTCSVTPEKDPNLSGPQFPPLGGKGLYFHLGSGHWETQSQTYVSFHSTLRHRFSNPSSPPNHKHPVLSFQGRGTSTGSLDSLPPALSQGCAPRFFRSIFWSLVTSFLSCPPGLGRLVLAAASLLVRPFRPPTPGNRGKGPS